jgi:DNA-3-methyladenine glycosylase II
MWTVVESPIGSIGVAVDGDVVSGVSFGAAATGADKGAAEEGAAETGGAGSSVLAEAVRQLPGFRPPLAPDPFEALVSSITAQQVSLHAAFAVRSRFIERFGEPAEHAIAFPTRERVAHAAEEELLALGFSRRKAEYVLGIARAELDFDELARLPDDEVKTKLTALRGLGEWSADWFLARHLARPHAWPAGDLGLRKAVLAFYPDVTDVRAAGVRFEPFQNLSAHYLLAALRYS